MYNEVRMFWEDVMLSERLTLLLDTLGVSNAELASISGLDPSGISRLKSGARVPKKKTSTIVRLAEGIISCAEQRGMTDILVSIVNPVGESVSGNDVAEFLIPAGGENAANNKNGEALGVFADRFNAVMELVKLSNVRLAKMINIDSSYISRFRNGKRTPRSNPELIDHLCQALIEQTFVKGQAEALTKMMGESSEIINSRDLFYIHFRNWLCDFDSSNTSAVHRLLESISAFPADLPPLEACEIEAPPEENIPYYKGIDGLQSAVLRFLQTVINSDAKEILLYSDQNMDWMVGDAAFFQKWKLCMAKLIQKGIRIKIIHNIDRNLDEMIAAIECWLPLYMMNTISPYYMKRRRGVRFSHTLFLCPDVACIEACNFKGCENIGLYNYYTDSDRLELLRQAFDGILECSAPLMKLVNTSDKREDETVKADSHFKNIEIAVSKSAVIVTRLSRPQISFVILHPQMREAFRTYLKNMNSVEQDNSIIE